MDVLNFLRCYSLQLTAIQARLNGFRVNKDGSMITRLNYEEYGSISVLVRVYSGWTRHVKFVGYNFAGFKSAFTLGASTRRARIADIPFTADILLSLLALETYGYYF